MAALGSPTRIACTNRQTIQAHPACVDCPPVTECPEPLCTAPTELTAQCTDQCVVIACSDPDHSAGESSHCDLVCDENIDCTDCHGFDAFLQCCDRYPLEPRSLSQYDPMPPFAWDPPPDDFWCGCGPPPDGNKPTHVHPEKTLLNPHPTSQKDDNGFLNKLIPPLDAQQSPFQAPLKPLQSFSCMWGSCQSSFTSLPDLIGHVNYHHLSNPSPESPLNSNHPEPPSTLKTSCLWSTCQNANHLNGSREALYNHLMNEHFKSIAPPPDEPAGASMSPVPPNVPPNDNLSEPVPLSEPSESSPLPTEGAHSCSGFHECRWIDCGLNFHSCDELTTHINSAHIGGGKPHYECFWDKCTRNGDQGFQSKQKICRHVQSHTGHRPFQCTICNQNFSEAATLQQHIRRHTQEKPYICDFSGCGKSFAITGALTIHKRTHNGDKPFRCNHCDRRFSESSNLSKHLRTHTGARPYVCTEPGCGKAFARPDQLNRHKGVHRKKVRGIGRVTVS